METIRKSIPFPVTTKQFSVVIAIGAIVLSIPFLYHKESEFDNCNNKYADAIRILNQYNIDYPIYKVALPTYNCIQNWDKKKV